MIRVAEKRLKVLICQSTLDKAQAQGFDAAQNSRIELYRL